MKAALVTEAGKSPIYGDAPEPVAQAGEMRVTVTAAALSQLVRGRASGRHYSAKATLPFIVGVDGVGTLEDGRRVYFALPDAPNGAMAERTVVPATHCLPLPDGLDDVTAAAIAIPGMSSWAALVERAHLRPGETVLVNGATGASGRLAVQIAKHLGAGKVIATGRNAAVLESLKALGADIVIPLTGDDAAVERRFQEQFAAGVDVVIDYLWGRSAELLLTAGAKAGPEGVPIRFVQVGSISGGDITLPAAALRSSAIVLMGSGLNSVPMDRILAAIDGVLKAAVPAGLQVATRPVPLSEVTQAWDEPGDARVVFIP
ncbi:MAG: zinc-binding alcohol dehydrogenase family protein [Azospirillaceae bacterium]|nr:zinc-binding alcohol dehydrogenase family protein [Azospirillaceae bacterium]